MFERVRVFLRHRRKSREVKRLEDAGQIVESYPGRDEHERQKLSGRMGQPHTTKRNW